MPEGETFDFWIGKWDLTWPGGQGGTPEGHIGRGKNVVRRILDDCIIQERFSSAEGFEGMSVSTLNARTKEWHQTWVDSHGGYLTFTGTFHDGRMELRTDPFTNSQGRGQINRMLWAEIRKDSLIWRWQRSLDDGGSWEDLWVIRYRRANGGAER